jgi:S1-C subfamily serine protease
MLPMGVWTENLALPAVINECMMQSYTGVLLLFPNTQNLGPAHFENLRAAGAFLVSAAHDGMKISHLSVLSEMGKTMRLAKPWPGSSVQVTRVRDGHTIAAEAQDQIVVFDTEPGEHYRIELAG